METTARCKECGLKPPISKNAPLCASCMAIRSNKLRKAKNMAPGSANTQRDSRGTKELAEKGSQDGKKAVIIDFGTHADILKQTQKLADDELRTLENQIIYILKTHARTVSGAEALDI